MSNNSELSVIFLVIALFIFFSASRDVEDFTKNHEPKLPSRFFIKTYVSTYQHGSAVDKVDVNDPISVKLLE